MQALSPVEVVIRELGKGFLDCFEGKLEFDPSHERDDLTGCGSGRFVGLRNSWQKRSNSGFDS